MSRIRQWVQKRPRLSKVGAALSLLMVMMWVGRGLATTPEQDDCLASTMTATKNSSPNETVVGVYSATSCAASVDYEAFRDDDEDGYAVAGSFCCFEPVGSGYQISATPVTTGLVGYVGESEFLTGTDCDDTDAGDNPGATEITGNGDDENCDGAETCFDDDDDDGFLDTSADTRASTDTDCDDANEGTTADLTTDCDDTSATDYPGAAEIIGNGDDEDCNNGEICFDDDDDDGFLDTAADTRVSTDTDCTDANEGTSTDLTTDCDDNSSTDYPGAAEIIGNGDDENCDGAETCYDDDDDDGFLDTTDDTRASTDTDCADANEGTNADLTTDCDDASATDYPGAAEIIGNGDDEDCDGGEICYDDDDDDGFLDTAADTRTSADTDCTDANEGTSTDLTTDCDDTSATDNPGAAEIIGNGDDENCDGNETCFDDDDNDGYLDTTGDTRSSTTDTDCDDANEGTNTDLTTDCDDADATENPAATEIVGNGEDDNCDGGETCFDDDDNDGFLDTAADTRASTDADCADANEGTTADLTTDCDDNDSGDFPGATETIGNGDDENCDGAETCYLDDDNDGYRPNSASTIASTDTDCADTDEALSTDPTTDCSDTDAAINPGATEIAGDGVDQDCSGTETCYLDDDNDGYRPNSTSTIASTDGDCNDTDEALSTDPTTDCDDTDSGDNPGATETIGNSDDEDCTGTETCYLDADNDGYRPNGTSTVASADTDCTDSGEALSTDPITDCDDASSADNPGATEITGNGDDENCDGVEVCYVDADNDGYRPNSTSTIASADSDCSDSSEALSTEPTTDCDDADAADNPAAAEIAGNSDDDDCDGTEICYADADNDGYRPNTTSTVTSTDTDCNDANEAVSGDPTTDCDDNSSTDNPGATEIVGNGDDENCDGLESCYLDADNDGYRPDSTSTLSSTDSDCADSGEALSTDSTGDCDDTDSADNPGASEIVGNGDDDNCNGSETCYVDVDNDGYRAGTGVSTVASTDGDCSDSGEALSTEPTSDCDDADAADNPGASETIGNSDDDNCDGVETCYLDDDNDGYRPSANPTATVASTDTDCSDADEALSTDPITDCDDSNAAVSPSTVETIANGVDENCDNGDTCYNDDDDDGYLDTSGDTVASADLDCADAFEGTGTDLTTDCDDNDAGDYPGAVETVANGDDEDCDGQETCYLDDDNDGYRPNAFSTIASTDSDCNDASEALSTDPTTDCDDADSNDNPGAPETVGNEDDEDCNGVETCYQDLDNDGYRTSSSSVGADTDCDDSQEAVSTDPDSDCDDNDANDNPGATEITGNSDDDNCDNSEICYDDDDNDGFLDGTGDTRVSADADCNDANEGLSTDPTTDCDDTLANIYPGATEVVGNGVDEDCDTFEGCYDDDDNDGYLDTSGDTRASVDADCNDANEGTITDPTTDCDDNDDRDYPGAPETVANGDDEDCDGTEICYEDDDDDGYLDTEGDTRTSADGDCSDTNEGLSSDPTSDCDDLDAGDNPGQAEIIGNGDDEDCDGAETCYDDDDNDGYLDTSGDTRVASDFDCTDPFEGQDNDPTTDCDDTDAGDYPGATEIYDNGDDEDCDGGEICYEDDDNDGYLDTSGDTRSSTTDLDCTDPFEGEDSDPTTDCDDTDANDYPGAPETIDNSDDEDCDGTETCYDDDDDDGYLDTSGDTRLSIDLDCSDAYEGVPSDQTTDCDDFDANDYLGATETIDNGDDEDCDGNETCYDDDDDDGVLDASGDTIESTTNLDCLDPREGQPSDATDDCDDLDAGDYPGATEIVGNEDDEDCDGTEICYLDSDNDGYVPSLGASSETIPSVDIFCTEANEGTVTDAALEPDCDDSDPDTFPGAAEIEDAEIYGGANVCMRDGDLDGWGDDEGTGDIIPGTDCDDNDAFTRPRSDDPDFERETVARLTLDSDGDGTPDVDERPALIDYNGNGIHDYREVLTDIDPFACYTDVDLDGYADTSPSDPGAAVGSDCEDDPTAGGVQINPGEDEVCEATGTQLDTDCDGSSNTDWDGNSLGLLPLYRDADDDGYGIMDGTVNNGGLTYGCSAGDGWSTLPIDCDDTLPQVNPSAEESCNETDDNCNGIVDDPINGDPAGCSLLYLDYDEDGYGDVDFPTCLCDTEGSLGVGSEIYDQQAYVSINTDCDDFDPAIHPVPPDCEDGRDNDNDGLEDLIDPDCGYSLCINGVDDDGDGVIDDVEELSQCTLSACNNNFDDDGDGDVDEADIDCDGACGRAGCFEDRREYNVERIDGSDDDCDRDILAIELDCDDDGAMPVGALRVPEAMRGETQSVEKPADLGLAACVDPDATIDLTCWDGEEIQLSCAVESGFWVFNYTTSDDGWVGRFVGGRREYPAGTSDDAQISFDCDDTCALRYGGADEICDGIDNDCSSFRGADTDQDGLPSALDEDAGLVEADREGTVTESELDIDQDGFLSCTDFDPDGAQLWPSTRSCSDQVVDTTLLEDCNDQCALVYPGMEPACDGFATVCDAELVGVDEDRDGHQTCGAWATEETDEHIYLLGVLIGEMEIGDTGDTGDTADSGITGPTEFVPLLLPRRRVPQNAGTVPIWYGDDLKEGDRPEIEPCDQGLYDALHAVFAGSEVDGVNPVDRAIAANDPIYLSEVCAASTTITCGVIRVDLVSTADEHLWDDSADTLYSVEWARSLGVISEECAEQSDELITRGVWPAGRIREARRTVTQWECYRLYGTSCENVQPQSQVAIPLPDTVGFSSALELDLRWWKEITRFNPTEVVSGTLRECWGDPQAVSTITLSDVGGDCADGNTGASRDEPEGPGDLMGIYNGDPAECSACLDGIDNNCDGQTDCDDPSCAPCFVGHGLGCAAEGSPCQGAGCEAIPTDPIQQSTLFAGLAGLAMAAIRRAGQSGSKSGRKVRG